MAVISAYKIEIRNNFLSSGAGSIGIGSQVIKEADKKEMMNLQKTIAVLFSELHNKEI